MKTKYTDLVDKTCPLPEYPRPQLQRQSYLCLNGMWQCAFTDKDAARPADFPLDILVPFSPEAELSGVNRTLQPHEALWYRRTFTLSDSSLEGHLLLHFDAVDQTAEVYVNGSLAGRHTGGYTAFELDIVDLAVPGENELVVRVVDVSDTSWHSRGKQRTRRGGIWYTAQSGIWQTVWLEAVPKIYVTDLVIRPLYDDGAVEVTVNTNFATTVTVSAIARAATGQSGQPIILTLPDGWEAWSPENPRLYDLVVTAGADRVTSYFGMRKFSVGTDEKGVRRLFLNGRPYFHTGVLDQNYYADGLLTPPCDEALVDDITLMREMGFNTLRMHIKIAPLRWYYHCDRLGMLVWQDMINGGGQYKLPVISLPVFLEGMSIRDSRYRLFSREDAEGRAQYYAELDELLKRLINVVSLAMWVPFNEGWGQFDAKAAVDFILKRDTTRTIDHASGWHDQHIGDTRSLHVYFRPYRFRRDKLGRAVMLTEFGGFSLREDGHCFNAKTFGYKKCTDRGELLRRFIKLYERDIIPSKEKGLCAAIYTQLSDVEDEVNGFVTYDREAVKMRPEDVRAINDRLRD